MVKNPLFELYEKLYFHEIEVREALGGRLQTPMAIIVSLIGVVAYLLQGFDKEHSGFAATAFLCLLALSSIALLVAIYFFVRSWFGSTYAFLPSAEATEQYRQLLQKTYEQYKDGDSLAETYLNDYLCTKYIECASQNTKCNDQRSLNIHRTNGTLIIATALVASSFLAFFVGDLDRTKASKPTEVVIVKPIDIKGVIMTEKKTEPPKEVVTPPPPPPPPPTRLIKEGVEIVKPQQEKKDGK
jgi:hypothetical protein